MKKEKIIEERKEKDTSKYGEFIPSEYNWLPIEKQKQKAIKLANITNKKESK